jgi:hypothetical protein
MQVYSPTTLKPKSSQCISLRVFAMPISLNVLLLLLSADIGIGPRSRCRTTLHTWRIPRSRASADRRIPQSRASVCSRIPLSIASVGSRIPRSRASADRRIPLFRASVGSRILLSRARSLSLLLSLKEEMIVSDRQ